MKKKTTALLLAVLLALTVCGCGGSKEAPAPTAAPTVVPTAKPTAEPTPEPTPEPTEEPTPEPTPDPVKELMGRWEGESYINEFLGMKYALPQGWQRLDDEQLLEMSGLTADMIKDEEISQALAEAAEEGKVFYALFAASPDSRQNFNLGFEKLNAVQTLAVTEEAYITVAEPQLKTALESMGLTDYVSEQVTVTLGGREMPALRLSGKINGVEIHELVAVCKQNGYIANFSFTSVEEDGLEAMTEEWSALS